MLLVAQNGHAHDTRPKTRIAEEICLAAIAQNGLVLPYVKDQMEAVCITAVKQKGWALEICQKIKQEAICMTAVKTKIGGYLSMLKDNTIPRKKKIINNILLE